MNVYQSLHRYASNKPANLPLVGVKIGLYAIAFQYHLRGKLDDKEKVSKYIDMLLEEFFAHEGEESNV